MGKIRLGLQLHAVREAFSEDPAGTLKRVAAMGYSGIEFNYSAANRTAQEYRDYLADAGLACYSSMASWASIQPDTLDKTIAYNKSLGTRTLVLGSVDFALLASEPDFAEKAVSRILDVAKLLKAEGFATGYHNHDSDFRVLPSGKTFFDYIFENTPADFTMMLDTGNTQGGGADPIECLHRFPGRTPIAHFKGYSQALGYLTPVWKAEIDSAALIRTLIEEGKTHIMSIEFGKRGDYDPFERAELSVKWLREQLENGGWTCE